MSKTIKSVQQYSNKILNNIQKDLKKELSNQDICIVTTGSFAREEASKESDMDYFVIVKNNKSDLKYEEKVIIKSIIDKYVEKNSGDSGTFGDDAVENFEDMLKNIGGSDDTNIKITRRMLLLLESKCLYNADIYSDIIEQLLTIYVKTIKKEQITRFLLNDIIRYYRTITVDFEFKTTEKFKSWGLRNIKLTYSRKLIYFVGILMVAITADLIKEEKKQKLKELILLTPLERINRLLNKKDKEKIYKLYGHFLEEVSKQDVRVKLEKVETMQSDRNKTFKKLKERSKKFSKVLRKSLKNNFDKTHRIHEAIIL